MYQNIITYLKCHWIYLKLLFITSPHVVIMMYHNTPYENLKGCISRTRVFHPDGACFYKACLGANLKIDTALHNIYQCSVKYIQDRTLHRLSCFSYGAFDFNVLPSKPSFKARFSTVWKMRRFDRRHSTPHRIIPLSVFIEQANEGRI